MHHCLGTQGESALPYPICSPGRLAPLPSASQSEGTVANSFIVLCVVTVYAAISLTVGELGCLGQQPREREATREKLLSLNNPMSQFLAFLQ